MPFENIEEIVPVLQNTKSVDEQAKIIQSRFPGQYDMFEEDGDLVIVDKKTNEEILGPKFRPTGKDYYSDEAVKERQKTAKEQWPSAAIPASLVAAPLIAPLAAGAMGKTALASDIASKTGTIKNLGTIKGMLASLGLGQVGQEIYEDPAVVYKEPAKIVLPLAGSMLGGVVGGPPVRAIAGTRILGSSLSPQLLSMAEKAGSAIGAGAGAVGGMSLSDKISGQKTKASDKTFAAVGSGQAELISRLTGQNPLKRAMLHVAIQQTPRAVENTAKVAESLKNLLRGEK